MSVLRAPAHVAPTTCSGHYYGQGQERQIIHTHTPILTQMASIVRDRCSGIVTVAQYVVEKMDNVSDVETQIIEKQDSVHVQ